jgi:hypothetical protein
MRPLELSVVVKEEGEKEDEEKFTLSLPDGTRHKQVDTFCFYLVVHCCGAVTDRSNKEPVNFNEAGEQLNNIRVCVMQK